MNQSNSEIEKRKEKIKQSQQAVKSLNDTSKIKENLLRMIQNWNKEDEESTKVLEKSKKSQMDQ